MLRRLGFSFWIVLAYALIVALACIPSCSPAQAEQPLVSAADRHKHTLVRAARFGFGLDAPVATLAAQVHQESRWNVNAISPAGAEGIAQFMPGTSKWMADIYPNSLGEAQPFNPSWALRAMVQYDVWIYERVQARSPCDKWALVLAAYNGGLGWVYKDKAMALASGASLPIAWRDIENNNAGRSERNFDENRHYVRVILMYWEPLYERLGWGRGVCSGVKL